MTTTKTAVREGAPASSLADELGPLVRVHADLGRFRLSPTRLKRARSSLVGGRVAFDAGEVIRSAGDLDAGLARIATAYEMCGLASARELESVRKNYVAAAPLLKAWLVGERSSADEGRRLALKAAAALGNGILRSAAAQASEGMTFDAWPHPTCPCCAGPPDLAIRDDDDRWLICSRCDTRWVSPTAGCLGCETTRPPTFVRVDAPDLGYELLVCHACARYLKERRADGDFEAIVERMLTVELDEAAERRGLRI